MIRIAAVLTTLCALATPVMAQDWDSYYNMATFGAGGGSDANGWLNFECGDLASGASHLGPYITMQVMNGAKLNKKDFPADITLWVSDEKSFLLPMEMEPGSDDGLSYVQSSGRIADLLPFIAALRVENRMAAYLGDLTLARITLEGSSDALEAIEGCIADAP